MHAWPFRSTLGDTLFNIGSVLISVIIERISIKDVVVHGTHPEEHVFDCLAHLCISYVDCHVSCCQITRDAVDEHSGGYCFGSCLYSMQCPVPSAHTTTAPADAVVEPCGGLAAESYIHLSKKIIVRQWRCIVGGFAARVRGGEHRSCRCRKLSTSYARL